MTDTGELPKMQDEIPSAHLSKEKPDEKRGSTQKSAEGSKSKPTTRFNRRTGLALSLGLFASKKIAETLKPSSGSGRGRASGVLIYDEDLEHKPLPKTAQTPAASPTQIASKPATQPTPEAQKNAPIPSQVNREKTKEYPTDVLSEQELKDLNLNIVSTNKDIGLLIRKDALTSDPLIKKLVEIKNRYQSDPNNPVLKVNVILADTDDLFRDDAPIPSEYRQQWKALVGELKAKGAKGSLGMFSPWWKWDDDPGWDIKDRQSNRVLRGSEAKHETYYIYLAIGKGRRPRPDQSFISPRQLNPSDPTVVSDEQHWSSQNKEYIDANRTPGFVWRHEAGHSAEKNEVRTDLIAYNGILVAYDEWQRTGDNKKYHFVFRTPEGPVYTANEEGETLKAA